MRSGPGLLEITTGGGAGAEGIGSVTADASIGVALFSLAFPASLACLPALRAASLVWCFLRDMVST